jgi:hypothetical protein
VKLQKGGRVRSVNEGTIKGYDDGDDIGVGTVQLSCKGGASLMKQEDEVKASTGELGKLQKGGRERSVNRGTIKGYDDGDDIGVGTVQFRYGLVSVRFSFGTVRLRSVSHKS